MLPLSSGEAYHEPFNARARHQVELLKSEILGLETRSATTLRVLPPLARAPFDQTGVAHWDCTFPLYVGKFPVLPD